MLSPPLVGSKRVPKNSVNSVCSVRENTPQRVACVLYHTVGAFYFSQMNTEERDAHPPYRGISVITPLPFGGGEGGGASNL